MRIFQASMKKDLYVYPSTSTECTVYIQTEGDLIIKINNKGKKHIRC